MKYSFGVVLIFWFVDNTSTFKKGLVTLGKYKLVQSSEASGFDRTTGIQIFVPIYYMLPNYAKIHVSTYELYESNLQNNT